MSWHYIYFYHHSIIHSYLGCPFPFFSAISYFPQTIQIFSMSHQPRTFNNLLRRTFSQSQLISISNFKYLSSTHLFSNSSLLPYNKLFGVDTSYTSSLYIKDNGRLFSIFSISNKTAENSVNGNLSLPIDFFNCFFTIPTNLSQKPPHQGAPSKWNFHVIPRSEQNN